MIIGIDPTNDYAFHKLFGTQSHSHLTADLIDAVLDPPPGQRITSVEILNPLTDPNKLDDKLAILDVKARDQSGRLFNIETQIAIHPALPERFLDYWSNLAREAEERARQELTRRVHLCERLLGLEPTRDEALVLLSAEELRQRADDLETRLLNTR